MALSAKYRIWEKVMNKKSQDSCYRKRNTPTLRLTEGAFEEMVAPLGHVHVETWVCVLQHHLVPPLLWRRRPVGLHLLHLVRLENHEDQHGRCRNELISRRQPVMGPQPWGRQATEGCYSDGVAWV